MKLYRWMKEEDGRPLVGKKFGMLGVRPKGGPSKPDVDAKTDTDIVSAAVDKGLSVSTDPAHPACPGDEFVLWAIAPDQLAAELALSPNPSPANPGHCLIKPTTDMTLAEYQAKLAVTREYWERVQPGEPT